MALVGRQFYPGSRGRRNYRRRRNYPSYGPVTRRRVRALLRSHRRMTSELKTRIVEYTDQEVSETESRIYESLCDLANGVEADQRIGNKVTLRCIRVNFNMKFDQLGVGAIRVMMVNPITPMDPTDYDEFGELSPISFLPRDQRFRYRMLFDQTYEYSDTDTVGYRVVKFSRYFDKQLDYGDNVNVPEGPFPFICIVSDCGDVYPCTIQMQIAVQFTDS